MRLDIAEASLGKLLATISLLDCATVRQGLTGYEIIPMLDDGGWNRKSTGKGGKGFAAQPIQELWDEYHKAAEQFYPEGKTRYLRTPSEELYRSLHTLDANGLANEFTLCVLPSLKGYTKTFQIYADAMAHPEKYWENGERWVSIEDSLEKLRRDYFHALSILVQSTMHGERKFVQAPAFNCTAFDIPPKLLALYCAVICWITQTLNDNSAREFYFLLAPGFRDDIYVQPLSMRLGPKDEGISHPHNLLIIHLNEKLFYEPSRLLGVLCHEISHHVGGESRRRKERARCIFRSLAMYIVCKTTPLIREEPEETPHRLIEQIVEAMADVMLRYYEERHKSSGLEYYITDLADFLTTECGWMGLLQMPAATAELIQNVAGRMHSLSRKGSKDELRFLAQLQDNLLHSNYVQSLLVDETTCYAAFDLMSRHVVRKLYSGVYNLYNGRAELVLSFHAMIEMTLQVHSEAYSDDRMIRLMGLDTRKKYEYFSQYYGDDDPQNRIRYEAVVRTFYPQEPAEKKTLTPDKAIDYFFSYTRKQVSCYLKHCDDYLAQNEDLGQKMTFTAQRLGQISQALGGEDLNTMFDTMHKVISEYQQALI